MLIGISKSNKDYKTRAGEIQNAVGVQTAVIGRIGIIKQSIKID